MDFDKSNVYTAANADDLHKGDFCVFADNLGELKERVNDEVDGADILSDIREEDKSLRFVSDCNNCYELAYLVCPVRNFDAFRAWRKGKAVEVSFDGGKTWVLWKRESKDKIPYNTPDWCAADYRPVVEQPKEKGVKVEYKSHYKELRSFVQECVNKRAQWHDVLKEKPKKSGLYLCNRMWRHSPMYELIYWTGEYWATGGDIDDNIISWYDFPEYEVSE